MKVILNLLDRLGFVINSFTMSITLPEDKRLAILKRLEKLSRKRSCKIRKFASLIGILNSICRAVPYGRVYLIRKREIFSLRCL